MTGLKEKLKKILGIKEVEITIPLEEKTQPDEDEDEDTASFRGSYNQGRFRINLRVEDGNINIKKLEQEEEL